MKICDSEGSHLINSGSTPGKLQKNKEMGTFWVNLMIWDAAKTGKLTKFSKYSVFFQISDLNISLQVSLNHGKLYIFWKYMWNLVYWYKNRELKQFRSKFTVSNNGPDWKLAKIRNIHGLRYPWPTISNVLKLIWLQYWLIQLHEKDNGIGKWGFLCHKSGSSF